jgi:preprotein translocase subunit SecG
MQYILMFLLFFLALFLIVLVLIQRGKGGGLAGAFGGMGGQSAFGTKAGDLFTKITIGVAAVWIILCVLSIKLLTGSGEQYTGAADEKTGQSSGQPVPGSESDSPPAKGDN